MARQGPGPASRTRLDDLESKREKSAISLENVGAGFLSLRQTFLKTLVFSDREAIYPTFDPTADVRLKCQLFSALARRRILTAPHPKISA